MVRQTFILELKWTEKIAPNVLHLAFSDPEGQLSDYIPGQFVTIHFEHEGKSLKRSYSIATMPEQSQDIEIAVTYVQGGPGTEYLYHLKPGDKVTATGPFGRLVLKPEETPQRYLMVATSTGVSPYRSMLGEFKKRLQASDTEVHVLEGVRTPEYSLYQDDFMALAEEFPHFHFHACYSRHSRDNISPHEYIGYVQNKFYELNPNHETDIVYVCGNPNMIDEIFTKLKEAQFEPKQVRREKYIS